MSQDAPWAAMINEAVRLIRAEVVEELRNSRTEVVEELGNEFRPRHDRTYAEIAEMRRELAAAREELARTHEEHEELRRRLEELEQRNSFLELIAGWLGKDKTDGPLPSEVIAAITDQTPRPPSIDRACAADPKDGVPRVDLPQHGLVTYARGSDPKVTWGSLRSLPHFQGEGTVNDDERPTPDSPGATRN